MESKKFLNDEAAKILLSCEECRDYVIKIISKVLNIDEEYFKDNLKLSTSYVTSNLNIKKSVTDVVYENNDMIINLEINYQNSQRLQRKNFHYICQFIVSNPIVGDKEVNLRPVTQINLNNFDVLGENKFIYHSQIMETSLCKVRSDKINIYDINVDFLTNLTYNDIRKSESDSLERLLYIFVNTDNNLLDKLYVGDKIMAEVRKKINLLSEEFKEKLYYDPEELLNLISYDKGKENGIEERNIEIVQNMLKENTSISFISKVTDLSINEIETIKQKMKEEN